MQSRPRTSTDLTGISVAARFFSKEVSEHRGRSGESMTVDFGYVRYPLGALIEWGKTYGIDFSVHRSKDGENFSEVGRITPGNGDIDSFAVDERTVWVNDRVYLAVSNEPDIVSIADFDNGDVIRLIQYAPKQTARSLCSDSGLLSAACEFIFSLGQGESVAFVISSPMRGGVDPRADLDFSATHDKVVHFLSRNFARGRMHCIRQGHGSMASWLHPSAMRATANHHTAIGMIILH